MVARKQIRYLAGDYKFWKVIRSSKKVVLRPVCMTSKVLKAEIRKRALVKAEWKKKLELKRTHETRDAFFCDDSNEWSDVSDDEASTEEVDELLNNYKLNLEPAMTEKFREFLKDTQHMTTRESLTEYTKWLELHPDIKERLAVFFSNKKSRTSFRELRSSRSGSRGRTTAIVVQIAVLVLIIMIAEAVYKSFSGLR